MRIFLLPVSTRRTLIYCEKLQLGDQPSISDKVVNKATTTWTSWEKYEKGWQRKITDYGNQLFRRIPFEEWGLKTLPPLSETTKDAARITDVLFPGTFLDKTVAPGILQKIATSRQGLHKNKLIWSVVGMPISAPFALVPVIPNLPFFYLAFRAWSHYKALYGSRYLEHLITNNFVKLTPSPILDELYAAGLIHPDRTKSRAAAVPTKEEAGHVAKVVERQSSDDTEEVMLLKKWNGKLLAERLELPEMEVEIERAVEQVEKDIESQEKLRRNKAELERVAAAQDKNKPL